MHVIDFVPPVVGVDGEFNTFRLGLFYSKKVKAGDRVYLMDNKEKAIVGTAYVIDIEVGPLQDMAKRHAHMNHAMLTHEGNKVEALVALLNKFYGPHIATPGRKTTVVYLRRVHDGAIQG